MTRPLHIVPLALALVACDPIRGACFAPPSVVNDVRILAVAAEPPEAHFDPATGIADPVVLRALIVQPLAEVPSSSVTWELCVADDDSPGCPPGSVIASDPEWGPQSSLRVQVPPDLLQQSIAADPLHGLRDVRVRAVIHIPGADRATASVLLFFSSGPGPFNRAPGMVGLRSGRDGKPLTDEPSLDAVLTLSVQHAQAMRPVLAPDALEEYDSVDLAGNTVHLRERVTYSFFSDQGLALGRGLVLRQGTVPVVVYQGLDDFEADEPDPGTPDTPAGLFDAVPVQPGGSAGRIWIVARDSRGAVSWIAVPYFARDERPNCQGALGPSRIGCPTLQFGCL
jgi:hypothetical protein